MTNMTKSTHRDRSAASNAPPGGAINPDLLSQLSNTLWLPDGMDEKQRAARIQAAQSMLADIDPAGGIETMLAAQMVAAHEAAMECLRRAVANDQSPEGRNQNLTHAERLLALYARQVDALGRHRTRDLNLRQRLDEQEQARRAVERQETEQRYWAQWLAEPEDEDEEEWDEEERDPEHGDAAAYPAAPEADSGAAEAGAPPEATPGAGDGATGGGTTGRRSYLNPGGI